MSDYEMGFGQLFFSFSVHNLIYRAGKPGPGPIVRETGFDHLGEPSCLSSESVPYNIDNDLPVRNKTNGCRSVLLIK
jgi:hypothetical protein